MERLKKYGLGVCLFVFLFVIIGGGIHLSSGAALIGALSGTPLVIYGFDRWRGAQLLREELQREAHSPKIPSLHELR